MQVLKSKHGTYLTDSELKYRQELIAYQFYCPITRDILNENDGEILFVKGDDVFISSKGIDTLIGIFGEKFINERLVSYD